MFSTNQTYNEGKSERKEDQDTCSTVYHPVIIGSRFEYFQTLQTEQLACRLCHMKSKTHKQWTRRGVYPANRRISVNRRK